MKIVDAFWEERNLGVTTYEITIEHQDTLQEVTRQYDELMEKQYMVVRIPSICHWAVPFFQERGYRFIETAITLKYELKQIPISKRIKTVFDKCNCCEMNDDDITIMYSEIDKGIFKTDRIFLDPYFKKELSAQRYKYWIADMIAAGNIPKKVTYANEVIGFFMNKEIKSGVYDGILAGVYSNFEGTGLGVCVQYMGLSYGLNYGAKKYMGHISANNIGVFKALDTLGFEIYDIDYILIKHN